MEEEYRGSVESENGKSQQEQMEYVVKYLNMRDRQK